ncbi:MAG: RNA polymerase factor sigma-70 [Planctomycetota bacterium]|nr:MAG: RNA polymerase factor sigma-70 [Planctomycetota bacterium]
METDQSDHPREDAEARYERFMALLAHSDAALRRFVCALMPDREGVDDVLQETFLECWKRFADFRATAGSERTGDRTGNVPATSAGRDEQSQFLRWACVIARYKVLSHQRDTARRRRVFRDAVIERLAEEALETLPRYEAERTAVERCLSSLPESQRRLLLAVHTPGDSIARIAAESGQNARRLYSRVNALRRQLLDCVKRRLEESSVDGTEPA